MTWWNSVQTSKGAAGFPAGAAAFNRRLRRRGARAAGRRESGFVVREIGYFLDIFGMTNPVVGIENKNRPALNSQVLDQSSIIGAERRSEEHTSELQSLRHLVCRLLLEK